METFRIQHQLCILQHVEENKNAFEWIPLSASLNLAPAAGMRGSSLPAQLSDFPHSTEIMISPTQTPGKDSFP